MQPDTHTPADTHKGRASRERILQAATELVARQGARGTTLAEIADRAGISQPGLIYHFPTKDALLEAVLDRRDELDVHLKWDPDHPPGVAIFDIICSAIEHWEDHTAHVGVLVTLIAENAPSDAPLHHRLVDGYHEAVDKIAGALTHGQRDGSFGADFDPRHKAMEILAFMNGLETAWLINPDLPVGAIARQWAAGLASGLTPKPTDIADQ